MLPGPFTWRELYEHGIVRILLQIATSKITSNKTASRVLVALHQLAQGHVLVANGVEDVGDATRLKVAYLSAFIPFIADLANVVAHEQEHRIVKNGLVTLLSICAGAGMSDALAENDGLVEALIDAACDRVDTIDPEVSLRLLAKLCRLRTSMMLRYGERLIVALLDHTLHYDGTITGKIRVALCGASFLLTNVEDDDELPTILAHFAPNHVTSILKITLHVCTGVNDLATVASALLLIESLLRNEVDGSAVAARAVRLEGFLPRILSAGVLNNDALSCAAVAVLAGLSIYRGTRRRILHAGAVPTLMSRLTTHGTGGCGRSMVCTVSALSQTKLGCKAIKAVDGWKPMLQDIAERDLDEDVQGWAAHILRNVGKM